MASRMDFSSSDSACANEVGSTTGPDFMGEAGFIGASGFMGEARFMSGASFMSEASTSEASTSETGFTSEASTSEAGFTSEASTSEDQLPTSTTEFIECASPEYEEVSLEEATNRVRAKLIETGLIERLKCMTERRLSEVGWRIDMMTKCREIVQQHGTATTFEMLFQNVRQYGQDICPDTIKEDMVRQIQACYEAKLVEK